MVERRIRLSWEIKNELLQKIDEKYSKIQSRGAEEACGFLYGEDYDKAAFFDSCEDGEEVGVSSQQLCVLLWRLDMKDTRASRRR